MLHSRAYGWQSAGQLFSFTFLRHMYDFGTTPAQVGRGARSPQRARLQQPQGLLPKTGLGGGRVGKPDHL
jgi:hypothetical protein